MTIRNLRRAVPGGVLLAVGGLAGYALSAQSDEKSSKPVAAPVQVRTQVIHRTRHVVKHEKPKHRKHGGGRGSSAATRKRSASAATPSARPAAVASAGGSSGGGYVPRASAPHYAPAPVRTRSSGSSSTHSAPSHPVTTRTSGSSGSSGSSGGERDDGGEHEGGDD